MIRYFQDELNRLFFLRRVFTSLFLLCSATTVYSISVFPKPEALFVLSYGTLATLANVVSLHKSIRQLKRDALSWNPPT